MGELITLSEAEGIVSRRTVAEAVKSGQLPVFVSGTDRRRRLVRADDVRTLAEPRPLPSGDRGNGQLRAS